MSNETDRSSFVFEETNGVGRTNLGKDSVIETYIPLIILLFVTEFASLLE